MHHLDSSSHVGQAHPSAASQLESQSCICTLQAGVDLTIDDFQRVSDKVPFIADLKPSGRYVMEDVHKVRFPGNSGLPPPLHPSRLTLGCVQILQRM
jgi:Dehydratase family